MKTKICSSCKQDLLLSLFSSNASKKDGLQNHCKECKKSYNNQYYADNKAVFIEHRGQQRKTAQEFYQELKSGLACIVCGEDEPVCIDLHHTNPEDKITEVIQLVSQRATPERILAEFKKCVPLCSNCHRKFHAGKITLPKHYRATT